MAKKNNNGITKDPGYITTIRHPVHKAIAANIFRDRAGDFTYLSFKFSRSWMNKTGSNGYSQKFLERHDEALADVALAAGEWIRKHQHLADGPTDADQIPEEILAPEVISKLASQPHTDSTGPYAD